MAKPKPIGKDDSGRPIFGYNPAGQPVCSSPKNDGSGKVCQSTMRMANGRCRFHGGPSTGRPMKHGNRSKAVLAFRKAVAKALEDPALATHGRNIARLGVLIDRAEEQLGELTPAERWQEAIAQAKKLGTVCESFLLDQLLEILDNGLGAAQAEERITVLAEAQRRHIEAENKRVTQLEAVITLRSFATVNRGVVGIIASVCNDSTIPRERIAAEIGRRLGELLSAGDIEGAE